MSRKEELKEEIKEQYQKNFPEDKVIVGDAYE